MNLGTYIILDDDFHSPIYADPDPEDVDEDLWDAIAHIVQEAVDGDAPSRGVRRAGEHHVAWLCKGSIGLTFVVAVEDASRSGMLGGYLKEIAQRYLDEVDDPRHPDRSGVEDVVVDVIPPWEE